MGSIIMAPSLSKVAMSRAFPQRPETGAPHPQLPFTCLTCLSSPSRGKDWGAEQPPLLSTNNQKAVLTPAPETRAAPALLLR